jgi:hypothetical protein
LVARTEGDFNILAVFFTKRPEKLQEIMSSFKTRFRKNIRNLDVAPFSA